jgi:nucleoside-diphosphate-sugar epimerase
VCGQGPGPALEELGDGLPDFRNDYEHSKFEAERLVRAAPFLDSVTIYRPAIIVGDSRTGYTATYHGLYAYAQFISVYLQYQGPQPDGRYHLPARLNATGREPRNLVPVDWVSAVIAHIFRHPEHHGRTYHLTPRRPVTAAELEAALSSYFNYHGPYFAGPDALEQGELNALERLFYDYVAHYQPYWMAEPLFDCRNTLAAAPHLPCPLMDRACLHRLFDFAVRDNWGKRGRARRAEASGAAADVR